MLKRLLIALAVGMICSSSAAAQTSAFPRDAEIQAMVDERVANGRARGVVVGVLDADGATRTFSGGVSGGASPLGPQSVFEIGSITKVLTATLLADMAQRGEVSLEAPAQTYAPEGMTLPTHNGRQFTLANLAEQNSGLPRMPGNFAPADPNNPYVDYDGALLTEFLASYQLPRDPGETFEYSNLGVGLLGYILASHAGTSYDELVRARILAPLGMLMTSSTLTPEMAHNLAVGHDDAGAPTSNWDIDALAGAGGLRSTVTDMLRFLGANVGVPQSDLERAMRDAQAPRADGGRGQRIGLNWFTRTTRGGVSVIWHGGATGGYRSCLAFDPAREIGVVALSNQATSIGVQDMCFHLLDPTMPLAAQRTEVALTPEQLARFTGVYAFDNDPGFQITITLESGALISQATGQVRVPVFAESETTLFARLVDASMRFTFGGDGVAIGFVHYQGGGEQPATRIGAPPPPRIRIDVPAEALERLAGVYAMDAVPGMRFTVTVENGALFVQLTGQPKFLVYATAPTEFFYEVVDAQLSFVVNHAGEATGLILHQNGDRPATKIE